MRISLLTLLFLLLFTSCENNVHQYLSDFHQKIVLIFQHKTYLLTTIQSSGEKVAYVLYNQDIIDEYTFNDIITQIPATDKSLAYIKSQYELIAL